MRHSVTAAFDITKWEEDVYHEQDDGPELSRATVQKTFSGSLNGESTAELLMCKADPDDLTKGAGYLASERITCRMGDRTGSFVIQHGGLSDEAGEEAFGHVVPGTGTGDFTGISGVIAIDQSEEGGHSLTLKYEFEDDPVVAD